VREICGDQGGDAWSRLFSIRNTLEMAEFPGSNMSRLHRRVIQRRWKEKFDVSAWNSFDGNLGCDHTRQERKVWHPHMEAIRVSIFCCN